MSRESTQPQAPSASARATAQLIVGLLLAITTPFLPPTALGALWVGVSLARGGHRVHAGLVFLVTAAVIAIVIAGLVA
ncbi:MAG: hypothetical protein ACRDLQ_00675 [Solirubrobacterales bacterium]